MARSLTAAFLAEILAARFRPLILWEGEFADGTVRLWSGIGTLAWNGQSWLGAGALGEISPIPESNEVRAEGIQCSLSGIPGSLLAEALGQVRLGKPVTVWFGALNDAGAVIADPYLAFAGRMDVVSIEEGAETGTISITVENELIAMQIACARRMTHEDQQSDFAGDNGFQYVEQLQERDLQWGAPGNSVPTGYGGAGSAREWEERKSAD